MPNLYTDLAWLPRAPADFSERLKACRNGDAAELGIALRQLAGHALDAGQLGRVANAIKAACVRGTPPAPLAPFRLGLIASATTSFMAPAIIGTGARHGFAIEVIAADYGQHIQAAIDPTSPINRGACDAVLVAIDHHALNLASTPGDPAAADAALDAALRQVDLIRDGLKRNGSPTLIVQTVARPPELLLGSFDYLAHGAMRQQIDRFNRELAARLTDSTDRLLDVAGLAETVGLGAWHDPALWHLAKASVAQPMLPLYAEWLCRVVAAIQGKSRKLLVTDLDNTVWGGIIGDDGLNGIRTAQGDPTGEAFLAYQRMLLDLRARGVVLAVSSKNDDATARKVFHKHPDILLREDHFAVFQANWNDKASNIRAICETLSLGLDAVVFVDDNPVERGQVRAALPQVAVPELPADPALVPRTVLAAGYFETVSLSAEDRQRADYYSANARRVALEETSGNIDDYLDSLNMVATFAAFDDQSRLRVTQLINKTNQFNLTTRRYTEEEVAAVIADPTCLTLQGRVTDIFGDNGIITALICRPAGADWEIDTWLMSCRVLGRRVESAVLAQLIEKARTRGIARLIGLYRPTERNGIVRDLYPGLGFTALGSDADGTERWAFDTAFPHAFSPFRGESLVDAG